MALGTLRKASRYLTRYREIFAVLVRYGLADWAHRINLDFIKEIVSSQSPKELLELSTEERVRRAIVELGPTFIKFGQMLSLRPDLVGVALSDELKELQSNVPPDPPDVVKKIFNEELGKQPEELFEKFDMEPVASASIGQAHVAWLKSGEKVAVKVRHADIYNVVETDLEILSDLAGLLEDYVDESRYYRPKETVEQFSRSIMRELDFNREARNIISITEDLEDEETVKLPKVYENLTTSRILVMEWIEGTPLNKVDDTTETELPRDEIAMAGAQLFLKMIFVNGLYHADPHPGNIMLCDGGRIGLLDFGMVGRLSGRMREYIEDMVAAIMARDSDKLARIIARVGAMPRDVDLNALGSDLAEFISFYGGMPVAKLKLFEALNEMVSIIHRHHIVLPTEIMMLIKTLITLEGSSRALSPGFNLFSVVEPYHDEMNLLKFSIGRKVARMTRLTEDMQTFAENVPSALLDIIERFRKGSLEIHMEHRGLEHSANRLVFGIITASLFVGSAMMLSFKAPPVIYDYSVFGLAGFVVAIIMGLRILWAVMMSGRLE